MPIFGKNGKSGDGGGHFYEENSIEGSATKLIPDLVQQGNPLFTLFEKARSRGLIASVCRACFHKMGTLEAAKQEGLNLLIFPILYPQKNGTRTAVC